MPRPDLAILVYDLSSSGVVRNAVKIANAMAERGLETEIWTVRAGGIFEKMLYANVKVQVFQPVFPKVWRRAETLLAAPAVARHARNVRPRVLLSAGNHFHLAAGIIHRLAGSPRDICLAGRASNAPPSTVMPLLGGIARAIDSRKYRGFEKVIAVSHELGGLLVSDLGLHPEQVVVIPNGVNVDDIIQRAAEPLDDPWFGKDAPPVILGAGRISRQKNFELLIRSFALLRKQQEARLVILGDGAERARARLSSLAMDLGISSDVRLHGFEQNPMRYFARASLFVLSSRWEGMSNVVLEALACGCPVVATDCRTGVREQLNGGAIGPLVTRWEPGDLSRAMLKRIAEPRNSAELVHWARNFSEKAAMDGYHRLLLEAAQRD